MLGIGPCGRAHGRRIQPGRIGRTQRESVSGLERPRRDHGFDVDSAMSIAFIRCWVVAARHERILHEDA